MACGTTNLTPPSRAAETAVVSTALTPSLTFELPTRVPVPTQIVTPDASQPVILTLWVPEEFATGAEHGGDVLEKQIAEFQIAHPNITINYVLKAPYGKGGMLDWLSQTERVDARPFAGCRDCGFAGTGPIGKIGAAASAESRPGVGCILGFVSARATDCARGGDNGTISR